MTNKKYNEKAINDIYKNAHIALQSIKDLIPSVDDKEIVKELREEYDGYENVIKKTSAFMEDNKLQPQDISVMKKAFMWGSIKMKTLMNNSRNQVAEMMIKGTVMGITELTAMKNEKKNLDDGVKEILDDLLVLEENYESRLKTFL